YAAIRNGGCARRNDHPGLGSNLRRARTLLRQVGVSLRNLGQGRQYQGKHSGRWQSVRGSACERLSQSTDGNDLRSRSVRGGGEGTGAQAVPGSIREHVARVHQSTGRATRAMHILRLLREVRLWQLLESKSADNDLAGSDAEIQFHSQDGQ